MRRADGQTRYMKFVRRRFRRTSRGRSRRRRTRQRAHLRPHYEFKPGHHIVPATAVRRTSKPPLFGPDSGYGPGVYRASYDFPKKMTGTGRATAFVGDADFLDTDLTHISRTSKSSARARQRRACSLTADPPPDSPAIRLRQRSISRRSSRSRRAPRSTRTKHRGLRSALLHRHVHPDRQR